MVLVKNLKFFFLLCFLDQIGPFKKKVFHDVLDRKLAFLHLHDKNREFKKGQNLQFLDKNWPFFFKFTVCEIK